MCPENDKDLEITQEEEKSAEETLVDEKDTDQQSAEEQHESEDLAEEVKEEEKDLDQTEEATDEDIKQSKIAKTKVEEVEEEPAPLQNVIFALRTTVGRESTVVDLLHSKLKTNTLGVKSILHPAELKGYVFIEGSEDGIANAIKQVPHIRGLIDKPIAMDDLKRFFSEAAPQITLKEGEIVEVIGGPFKREKAKIVRVDEAKREARIELIESAVPIPITISLDLLKATR